MTNHLIQFVLAALFAINCVFGQESAPDRKSWRFLERPITVRFEVTGKKQKQSGKLERFNTRQFSGTFGTFVWIDLPWKELDRLYKRVMDRESSGDWVELGRLLNVNPAAQDRSDAAFAHALRLDPGASDAIEAARADGLEIRRLHEESLSLAAESALRQLPPEAGKWGGKAWPVLDPIDRSKSDRVMLQDAKRMLAKAGVTVSPIETEHFIIFSDVPAEETTGWKRELESMYMGLSDIFSLPDGSNIFWGKAVIFIHREHDSFRLMEAAAFKQKVPPDTVGLCHCIGPRVFVNMHRDPDDRKFAAVLVHETVHGFMHRFISPQRLPTWANEGFAEYVAAHSFDGSPVDRGRRQQGLAFIRQGGSIESILEMSYVDGTWPGYQAVGYSVGYLLCSLMIENQPRKFGAWVKAIKHGKPWDEALKEDFGVNARELIRITARHYTPPLPRGSTPAREE